MGLVSNSKNPKLIFVEQGSAPATPDSGEQKVFIRSSDHHVCRVNSAGSVTDIENEVASGGVVQVVNTQTGAAATGTTIMPLDDTIPQKTEGDEYMTLAITPTSATNKLRIDVVGFWSASIAAYITIGLFQDSANDALAATTAINGNTTFGGLTIALTYYMTAGTTSATTFKVRAGPSGVLTVTFNGRNGARHLGGVPASSITITEIKV